MTQGTHRTRGVSKQRLRRWLKRAVLVYLCLLVASHGVRWLRDATAPPSALPPNVHSVDLPEITTRDAGATTAPDRLRETGGTVRMAWYEWGPENEGEVAPVVLLVHGSPGDGSNFDRLGPLLADHGLRAVAPDLPGFGHSTHRVADYSIRAHAEYCRRLLRHLDVGEVHAVGFSLGGGVALHLEELAPERVASLTLLSAIGVQELELLGNYHVNHAVHGAQLALVAFLMEGLPHFGLLDQPFFGIPYARNFFESDQRPLRGLLQTLDDPMLILHGEDDFLVPYEAALEHRRIVPQSRLVSFDEGHFLVFTEPQTIAEPLADFVRRVESGDAETRADASEERLRVAEKGRRHRLPKASGPTLMVWIVLLAVATLVSEDLTCVAAGLLVAQGSLGYGPAVLGCALGIFFGDLSLYGLGRLGRPWLHRIPLRWIVKPRSVARSEVWFRRRGPMVIFLSRFLPGTRVATYVTAGFLGMGLWRFALSLAIPVALWVPALVGVSQIVGKRVFTTFAAFEAQAVPIFFAALAVLWILVALGRSLLTWRGRRRLVGRWKKWTRWEFWPPWLVYPPVIVRILLLALRHRSATLFTAANPGMPEGGGFLGESKAEILRAVGNGWVPPFEVVPPAKEASKEERREVVGAFRRERADPDDGDDAWPVVLKPDVGERGRDVVIARSEDDVDGFLDRVPGRALVQEYASGPELGVFWIRLPGEETGRIFSITDKRFPTVTGDGESTLEHLILADDRAVALAGTYLDRFAERLGEVPADGEEIRLVDVGTHCRGAVFLDGERYRTPDLEATVAEIAATYEGFHFGRFDLKAPTRDHYRRGEGIRVIEVNGVTSEATHIYDPSMPLLRAYRTLFEQWELAFEAGRRNRERGHEPIGLGRLVGMVWSFLRSRLRRRGPADRPSERRGD